jgi:hypothetical protein
MPLPLRLRQCSRGMPVQMTCGASEPWGDAGVPELTYIGTIVMGQARNPSTV